MFYQFNIIANSYINNDKEKVKFLFFVDITVFY